MKSKILSALLVAALLGLPAVFSPAVSRADDTTTEQDRIRSAGTVLKEIMNIPDNIPQSLIDKADCVIVYPTVLKAAFHRRRELRTRCDDLPQRRTFPRSVERAGHDGPRRRQRRIPNRRTSDGLRHPGDE